MKFVLRYLELIFTAAGLLVIFGATALVHPTGASNWAVAAVTATIVGVIHGVLFWIVRNRQRTLRAETIKQTEAMLRNVVMNQLSVIRLGVELQQIAPSADTKQAILKLGEAIDVIYDSIDGLSEESLARWQARYHRSLRQP
jgi:membrane protein implicated in regulation of membrane protease activity